MTYTATDEDGDTDMLGFAITVSASTTQTGSLGECYVSLSVGIGQSCTYPGTTAPSNAGTYYYGACVDPVSGESGTGNNCFSAVLVTVTESQMGTETFDLDPNNGDPSGITFANNKFYSVDYVDDNVYALNSTASPDFDLFVSFADLHYSLVSSPGDPIEMSALVWGRLHLVDAA